MLGFLFAFLISLSLTALIGVCLPLRWAAARTPRMLRIYWGIALLVHLDWFAIPHLGPLMTAGRWLAIFWLAVMLSAFSLLVPFALLVWLSNSRHSNKLLSTYFGACISIGLIVTITSTGDFVIREQTVEIAGLPAALDGFRIANLGDVHLGRFIDVRDLDRIIDGVNAQHVDLIAVTGDLVDDLGQLEDGMRALERNNTPYKVIAVLGNHEEAIRLPTILAAYKRHESRICLLVNESTEIGYKGATLTIVGVDFPLRPRHVHWSQADEDAAMSLRADKSFSSLASHDFVLALSHNPNFFPFAAAHGAQLTLASHTHGGQMKIFGHTLIPPHDYMQGIYHIGDAVLDVSAGVGHWFPIRFGVPREAVIVTLRAQRLRPS